MIPGVLFTTQTINQTSFPICWKISWEYVCLSDTVFSRLCDLECVWKEPGPRLNIKTVFHKYGIPMKKMRRSRDRLIFNMGMHILVRRQLYIETTPRLHFRRGGLPSPPRIKSTIEVTWVVCAADPQLCTYYMRSNSQHIIQTSIKSAKLITRR